jgi:hypothetical protein
MLHLRMLYLIFIFLGTYPSILYDDKENYDHKDPKTKVLLMFHDLTVLIHMMITIGSGEMIIMFLCLILCNRQTIMFAICP